MQMKRLSEHPLVSIIIPCHNGEQFLSEAIDSCFNQTYRPIEVIVINDGSFDGSLDIIKSYGNAVICETERNRGPSAARNRGFILSSGKYIQYLDADDYLIREKLQWQVQYLEETGVDVVYGDWRILQHLPNGESEFRETLEIFGPCDDIKARLLSDSWLKTEAPLFRRSAVERSGGWDENIRNAEEKDFQFSVAMAGGVFHYLPGWVSVYRRYGSVTLSTRDSEHWIHNAYMVFKKMETKLKNREQLSTVYREALAVSYYSIARRYYETDSVEYQRALAHARRVCPGFNPRQSTIYNLLQKIIGMDAAQRVAYYKRWVVRCLSLKKCLFVDKLLKKTLP